MGVLLIIIASVVALNVLAGAGLLTGYLLEQRRERHIVSDAHLASIVETWQRELTSH